MCTAEITPVCCPRISYAESMDDMARLNYWNNVISVFEGGEMFLPVVDGDVEGHISLVLPQTERNLSMTRIQGVPPALHARTIRLFQWCLTSDAPHILTLTISAVYTPRLARRRNSRGNLKWLSHVKFVPDPSRWALKVVQALNSTNHMVPTVWPSGHSFHCLSHRSPSNLPSVCETKQ